MSVLSSASRSKPKERPEITSSIISRPGKKIEPEEQQPARRERRPRPERRKPQNAETPKQQEKPAEKPARPEKQERPQAPKQEKPRAPRPEKPQQPAPAAPKEYAPAPEGSMEEKIEKFLTGLLTHMNSTAVPHAYRTEEGSYRAELVGGDVGMLIGRRGETLDAIQYLTSYAINRRQRDARARQRRRGRLPPQARGSAAASGRQDGGQGREVSPQLHPRANECL